MDGFKQFITESYDASQEHEILSLYKDSNQQIRRISETMGMSIGAIYRILEKYGIRPHRRNFNDQYNVIQQYFNSGVPAKRISELTGYSKRQVYNIVAKGRSNLGNVNF
jgi:hypothetical protein